MAVFRIRVQVDPRQATAGIDRVDKRLQRLQRTADRLRTQFAAGLGIAGFGLIAAGTIRTLANFEQTMSTVRAISGATEAQFVQLTDTAKQLGATTRFSATQAGESLLFLSRAGFDVNESIEAVDDTLKLAQAGALELGQAADIASNVIQGFRLGTDQAGRVVDVLALAANSANTNVTQLGTALSFAAPIASGLGVSIEETTAAIGALSNAGIQGTRAGTGLVRVLAELETPGTKALEIFNSLGVSAEEVRVSQVGLTAAIQRLNDAGLDAGQALEAFGKRGGPTFEVLQSSIPTVEDLNEKLNNAEGTADRVAATMDDNLNGALLAVKSAAEAVVLEFGSLGASSFLTKFLRGLATVLRTVAANLDAVLTLVKGLTIAMAFAGRGPIPLFGNAMVVAAGKVKLLTLAIAANPIGALVVGVTAAVTALIAFRDSIRLTSEGTETLGDLFTATAEIAQVVFGDAIEFLRDAFIGMGIAAEKVFGSIDFSLAGLLRGVARTADFVQNVFVASFNAIKVLFDKLPNAMREAFIVGLNFVLTEVEDGVNKIIAALNRIPGVDIEFINVPKAVNDVQGAGAELGNALIGAFEGVLAEGPAQQLVERLLNRAREIAAERTRNQQQSGGDSDAGTTGGQGTDRPPPTGDPSKFAEILSQLDQQARLLRLNTRERERAAEIIKIEEELEKELTDTQRALVDQRLRDIQALTDQANLLEEIRGPQEELNLRMMALNQLFIDNRISAEEFNNEMLRLQQVSAEASNTIGGGISAGLLQIANRASEVGKTVQGALVQSFDRASDAIAEFVTTGKLNFKQFAVSLIQDLAKLAIKLTLVLALKAALGLPTVPVNPAGLVPGLGSAFPGFQNGGAFNVGGSGGPDSQLVAFRATPNERVSVQTPAQQIQRQEPIVVQAPPVMITNVTDPDDIPNGIQSPEGEQAVLNVIGRNPEAIRSLVQT